VDEHIDEDTWRLGRAMAEKEVMSAGLTDTFPEVDQDSEFLRFQIIDVVWASRSRNTSV
jgi:hypothetical protein